ALSTLTSFYQYPTKPLPSLDVIPFNQISTNKLDHFKLQFTNANALQFYTDGSLTFLGSPDCQMGIAWLQTNQNWPLLSFNATFVSHSPSLTLVEIVAILAATYTAPPNSNIEICTDSQAAIASYYKIITICEESSSLNPAFKIPYFHIWMILMQLITSNNIVLSLTKVKAHGSDKLNNKVDALAKQLSGAPLSINNNHLGPKYFMSYNNIPIITLSCLFIKYMQQASWAGILLSLPQFAKYHNFHIDWQTLFYVLNDSENARSFLSHLKELNRPNNDTLIDAIDQSSIWYCNSFNNNLCFMDLIKGIIPSSFSSSITSVTNNKQLTQ
ncbi:8295_t:CDS:2, partial [Funneliformis caledonium]